MVIITFATTFEGCQGFRLMPFESEITFWWEFIVLMFYWGYMKESGRVSRVAAEPDVISTGKLVILEKPRCVLTSIVPKFTTLPVLVICVFFWPPDDDTVPCIGCVYACVTRFFTLWDLKGELQSLLKKRNTNARVCSDDGSNFREMSATRLGPSTFAIVVEQSKWWLISVDSMYVGWDTPESLPLGSYPVHPYGPVLRVRSAIKVRGLLQFCKETVRANLCHSGMHINLD